MVSMLNRGGNKLDQFLQVGADLTFQPAGPDAEVTLRIALANLTPEGEPTYVAGPEPSSGVGEGVHLGILAVTLPRAGGQRPVRRCRRSGRRRCRRLHPSDKFPAADGAGG